MKSTGIVRCIDNLGRIVIPKELRKTYGIAEGDSLEIFTDGDRIVLRKYVASGTCVLCGEADDKKLKPHRSGKMICTACAE